MEPPAVPTPASAGDAVNEGLKTPVDVATVDGLLPPEPFPTPPLAGTARPAWPHPEPAVVIRAVTRVRVTPGITGSGHTGAGVVPPVPIGVPGVVGEVVRDVALVIAPCAGPIAELGNT